MASMKLAYNNIDKQREKEEAKLMQTDPKKAQQLERLGMAVGTRTTGISHSAVSDMQIIQQDARPNQQSYGGPSKSRDFFDEMEGHFTSSKTSSSSNNNSNNDYLSRDSDFESSFKGFTGSCKSPISLSFSLSVSIYFFYSNHITVNSSQIFLPNTNPTIKCSYK